MRDFSKRCPSLEKICISICEVRGCTFFDAIAKYFPKLTSLELDPAFDYEGPDSHELNTLHWVQENENVIRKIKKIKLRGCFTGDCVPLRDFF